MTLLHVMSVLLVAFSGASGAGKSPRAPSAPPAAPVESAPPEAAKPSAAAEEPRDEELEKRLVAIDAAAAKVESLRGRFVQTKHTALLKKPLVSSGTFVVKGELARWETREPRPSVMAVDEGRLRLYFPEQKVVEVYELGEDVREFAGSPLPRLEKLRGSFRISRCREVEPAKPEEGARMLGLELTPREGRMKEHVARIRVLIDTDVPAVSRMEIEDADGERTVIELLEVSANAAVKDADVEFSPPRGTREVYPLRGRGDKGKEPASGGDGK